MMKGVIPASELSVIMVSHRHRGDMPPARVIGYGELFRELHIVLLTRESSAPASEHVASNVWLNRTRSRGRLGYVIDAIRIGSRIARELRDHADRGKHILVTAQDPFETGFAAYIIARRVRAPLRLEVHTDIGSKHFVRHSIANGIRLLIARYLFARAAVVRVVNERVRRVLIDRYRVTAPVFTLPIFIERFLGPSAGESDGLRHFGQVLMAGRLEREKDVSLALKVIARVHAKHPSVRLVVVGDGSLKTRLAREAKALGIGSKVVFRGWQQDLSEVYAATDVYFSTSRFEGYGLATVEAALHGCAVVTADVGIAGDLFKDDVSACICPVGHVSCFVKKLTRLQSDRAFRDRVASAGREAVASAVMTDRKEYHTALARTFEIIQ